MPAIPGYIYKKRQCRLCKFIHRQCNETEFKKQTVRILQETDYPWDGKLHFASNRKTHGFV